MNAGLRQEEKRLEFTEEKRNEGLIQEEKRLESTAEYRNTALHEQLVLYRKKGRKTCDLIAEEKQNTKLEKRISVERKEFSFGSKQRECGT
jgi:hypothetical protein